MSTPREREQPNDTGGDRPPLCQSVADFYTADARRHMRLLLAGHLNAQCVTPLQVLHSFEHARRLNDDGTTLLGVLQRLASAQAQEREELSTQDRLKTLTALTGALLQELRQAAKERKVPGIRPGGFADAVKEVRALYPESDLPFHIHRMLTAYIVGGRDWLDKLERLGRLWDGRVDVLGRSLLDAQIAEFFSMAGTLKALTGDQRRSRLDVVLGLIDLYVGKAPDGPPPTTGIADIFDLLQSGELKQTRDALRERIGRELEQRAFLLPGEDVLAELEAIRKVEAALEASPPPLHRDPGVRALLELRSARAITPETVQGSVAAATGFTERLAVLLRIAELSIGAASRTELSTFVRGNFSVEDIIRDILRREGERWRAVGPLVRLHGQLGRANLDADLIELLQGRTAAALNELISRDILGDQNQPYAERIARLVESCADEALPAGKSRQLAAAAIGNGLRSEDFLPAYARRYRGEAQRKQALLRLRNMMLTVGVTATAGNGATQGSA